MLETTSAFLLKNIFDDADFAWKLLEAQISIQMSPIVQGLQIAKLLQLYMKGVQKMNSVSDQRQSYFKNKVTTLMTKQTVIKSLKQNPMKKKSKHEEAVGKQQLIIKKQKVQNNQNSIKANKLNHLQLKQKQKQFEMRMAHTANESNPQALKKLILQQQCREQNISKKITGLIQNHEDRLQQRIKQRKLRTATYRTQSQYIQQSQTQPSTNKFTTNKKQHNSYFMMGQIANNQNSNNKQQNQKLKNKNSFSNQVKKYKSLQNKRKYSNDKEDQFVIVRKRKYTIDFI